MSIEDILLALDEQCREECQDIFGRAEQEAKRILEKADREAEAIRKARYDKAKAEATGETVSMLYSARLRSKNAVISAKEEVAEKAFRQAEERLRAMRDRRDYPEVFEGLAREGLERISGKALLHVDPADEGIATSTAQKLGLDCEVRTDIQTVGGVVISDANGRVRIVNTVEERLNRAREKLRMQVSAILFEDEAGAAAEGG